MKRYALITATLFASAMLSGCGEKEITGQAFVVTQAKDNIKLALVTVGAIPQDEFDQFLKAKQIDKKKRQDDLRNNYDIAKSALIKLEDQINKWGEFIARNTDVYLADKKLWHKDRQWHMEKIDAMDTIAGFERFDKPEYLLEGLPVPKLTSKTDADGKFALKLSSGKYVITASSRREVLGSSETYHWLVTVDTSNIKQPLMLSNDNLLETKCAECVKF